MSRSRSSYWMFVVTLVVLYLLLHIGMGLNTRTPDLMTVAVLFAARRLNGAPAAGAGFLVGLIQDALSLTFFGASALTKSIIGFVGVRAREFFVGDSFLFIGLYLFAGKWLHDVLFGFIARGLARGSLTTRLFVDAPLAALYAAAAGLVALTVYRLLTRTR